MLGALALSAVLYASSSASLSADQLAEIKNAAVMGFTDYDTIKVMKAFAFIQVGVNYKWPELCVLANTKNRAGGYTGYQWYTVGVFPDTKGPDIREGEYNHCDKSPPLDDHDYAQDIAPR